MRIVFVAKELKMEPLGIMYLSAALKKAGHTVSLMRMDTDPDLVGYLSSANPDVLAYSVCSGLEDYYVNLHDKLGEMCACDPIGVFGGPAVTFNKDFSDFINTSPGMHALGGECECSFVKLLEMHWKDPDYIERIPLELVDVNTIPEADRDIAYQFKDIRENPIKNVITRRGCKYGCSYCTPPDTLVFMADSTTKKIGDVRVGEKVLGFTKHQKLGDRTRFTAADVVSVNRRKADLLKGTFEDGTTVLCTPDHSWFTGRNFRKLELDDRGGFSTRISYFMQPPEPPEFSEDYWLGWLRGVADGDGCLSDKLYAYKGLKKNRYVHFRLVCGDQEVVDRFVDKASLFGVHMAKFDFHQSARDVVVGGSNYKLKEKTYPAARVSVREQALFLCEVQADPSEDYMKGWVSGLIDTDGCLSKRLLSISQKPGPVLDRCVEYLRDLGFDPVVDHKSDGACRLRFRGGLREAVRLIATVIPTLNRKREFLPGVAVKGSHKKLVKVEPAGYGDVVSLTTSSETYISQGFLSHNCFNREWNKLFKDSLPKGVIRYRTVDSVVAECKNIFTHWGATMFNFVDDNFASDIGWLREFAKKYGEELCLPFFCSVRPEDATEEAVRLIQEAGGRNVNMAIESANDVNRRTVLTRKGNKDAVKGAIKRVRANRMLTRLQNIIGLPVEDPLADAYETLDFNIEVKPTTSWCAILQAYPGTTVHRIAKAGGYVPEDDATDAGFFGVSTLKIKDKRKVERLHKLWPFLTQYPRFRFLAPLLIRLPLPFGWFLRFHRWTKKMLSEREFWAVCRNK